MADTPPLAEDFLALVGARIRARRRSKGVTVQQLADEAGISRRDFLGFCAPLAANSWGFQWPLPLSESPGGASGTPGSPGRSAHQTMGTKCL